MNRGLLPSKYNPGMEMKRPDFDLRYVFDEKPPVVELHAHVFFEFFFLLANIAQNRINKTGNVFVCHVFCDLNIRVDNGIVRCVKI